MAWEKVVPQKDAVKAFLVTQDGGKLDVEASVEKYRAACLQYNASQLAENELVSTCMTKLFDWHRGTTLNMDFIRSQTISLMTKQHKELAEPNLFAMLGQRVEDYLHENCNVEASEATAKRPAKEAITGKIYARKIGKAGGFYRVSDQAPSSATK